MLSQPVDESLEEGNHEKPRPHSAAHQALQALFQDMLDAASTTSDPDDGNFVVSPRELCRTLGINVLEQQDSQEFWKLLLPALDVPRLTDLYQGAYQDYLIALDGSGREKRREEPFLDLSLDVAGNDGESKVGGGSVESALTALFQTPERLSASEGNGWRPSKGDAPIDAHKGSLLTAAGLPPILQLHLKRFHYDWSTGVTTKLNHPFAFPVELDLASLCEGKKEEGGNVDPSRTWYDLQAIVVHAGNYGSGHYYSYVRPDVRSEAWYRFNDHVVEPVSYAEVYRDACGGQVSADQLSDESSPPPPPPPLNALDGPFKRFPRNLFQRLQSLWVHRSSVEPYGYGGRTSNAYVLQYVRRSDVPSLYDDTTEMAPRGASERAGLLPQ